MSDLPASAERVQAAAKALGLDIAVRVGAVIWRTVISRPSAAAASCTFCALGGNALTSASAA